MCLFDVLNRMAAYAIFAILEVPVMTVKRLDGQSVR